MNQDQDKMPLGYAPWLSPVVAASSMVAALLALLSGMRINKRRSPFGLHRQALSNVYESGSFARRWRKFRGGMLAAAQRV